MTTGHRLDETVIRSRRRPKKTSANSAITWPVFEGSARKDLPVPTFIDMYNRFMGGIDISNSLRATATTHFNRCQKEYFPGIFFCLDSATTNAYKIYQSLYGPFLSKDGTRDPTTHRVFLERLVDLIFLCNTQEYPETVPGTTFKEYPRYNYIPPKPGPTPKKQVNGRPRTEISISFEPIENHIYIQLDKKAWCTICPEIQRQRDKISPKPYSPSLSIQSGMLREKKSSKSRIRGKLVSGKCSCCNIVICKSGSKCWEYLHSHL